MSGFFVFAPREFVDHTRPFGKVAQAVEATQSHCLALVDLAEAVEEANSIFGCALADGTLKQIEPAGRIIGQSGVCQKLRYDLDAAKS